MATIREHKPDLVFAAHVETASGIMLPPAYLRAVADAVHEHGGLFVLDCIASGAIWVDMQEAGVDILISAPQKGWSGPACAGLVMLGDRVRALLREKGFRSVAAPGFEAPGVVVCYTEDDGIQSARKFAAVGIQAAAGVPLQCGEPADFKTFRIGLFGLDKWSDIDGTVDRLARAIDQIQSES